MERALSQSVRMAKTTGQHFTSTRQPPIVHSHILHSYHLEENSKI